jgi:hypothetical protein
MARLKPQPEKLTFFFFMTSLGGALGGVFVTFVAPFLFRGFFEFHLSIILAWALAGVCFWLNSGLERKRPVFRWGIGAWGVVAVAIGYFLMLDIRFRLGLAGSNAELLRGSWRNIHRKPDAERRL